MQSRGRVVVLGLVFAAICSTARPARANCGAGTTLYTIEQSGALQLSWTYDPGTDTYDLTLHNMRPVWYFVLEAHPATGGACWPFTNQIHPNNLPDDDLPAAIAPNGKLVIHDVHGVPGDQFAICHIGFNGGPPEYFAESAWVKTIAWIDVLGLDFFGQSFATVYLQGGAWETFKSTIKAFDPGLLGDIVQAVHVFGDPNATFGQKASALNDATHFSLAEKSAMMEIFRSAYPAKVASLGKGASDLFELNSYYDRMRRLVTFLPELASMSVAYGLDPWGRMGIRVVAAPPSANAPPEGFIVYPRENEIVGNTITVNGVGSDDCSPIEYVNATYSTDNGQTWVFAGQDTTSPYDITVNLSAVPDGTNVLLGWDVHAVGGAYTNSPSGHRRVIKNAAAFAPPANQAEFVADVAPYIDGAVVAPGYSFVKGWRVRNDGTTAWTSAYSLVFVSGTNLTSVSSVPLPPTAPGQVATIQVPMTAPMTPLLYRSTWRLRDPAGVQFGSSVFALIEVRAEAPGSGMCAANDRCLNMGCSTHSAPPDGTRFKTPATGSGVFYARAGYRHSYPTSVCYHLFYDDFSNLSCIANTDAAPPNLLDGPQACTEGSFYRQEGYPAMYRMESGLLRPLCGNWTSASFLARWSYPFQIAFLVDSAHFDDLTTAFPIAAGNGIYPAGQDAPQCGDPGLQCGDHVDPDGVCYGALHCGGCGAGAQCLAGTCVVEQLAVSPGIVTSPADGATIPSGAVTIGWAHGDASDGGPVSSALICSVDGGPWEVRVGYTAQTSAVVAFAPEAQVQCKLRSRLDSAWGTWIESAPASWLVSDDTAVMTVVAVAETAGSHPNGCDDLTIEALVRNDGALAGVWDATAYLHPILEDEHSSQAIAARQTRPVALAPGAQGSYTFDIDTPLPLSSTAVEWAVTVVVTDPAAYGPTGRGTADAAGHDSGGPQIDVFQLYGFAGAPVELVPGRAHTIQLVGSDDHALASWELAWRSDGTWTTIAGGNAYTSGCRVQHGVWHSWTVPVGLPADTLIEVRARYIDQAGNLVEQLRPARLRSSAAPSVTLLRPGAGEQYVSTSAAAPTCVPIEAIVVPGVPVQSIVAGFTGASHAPLNITTTLTLPPDGHVVGCLPANYAGDAIEVFLRVTDTNGSEFMSFAGPVTVAFAPPQPPWQPVIVEPTQGPPPPAPVPATQGGQTATEYVGLKADASTVTVYRSAHARWTDPDLGTLQDRYALRRLTFALADVAPLSSTSIVDTFTELDPTPADSFQSFRVSGYDEWPYFFDAAPLAGCMPSSGPCDYEARVRDVVAGGPGSWRALSTYLGRLSHEAPMLDEGSDVVPLPAGGGRLLSLRDLQLNTSTLFRSSGGAWSALATHDPALRGLAAAQGALWGFRRTDGGAGITRIEAMTIDPATGMSGPPTYLLAGDATGYSWTFARDPADDAIVVAAIEPGANRLRIARLQGGIWVEAAAQPIAATWRGHPLTFRFLAQLQATGGWVRAVVSVAWSGGGTQLAVMLHPGDPIDLERAFIADDVGSVALAPDGRLVKTFVCRWNFEDRLCVQLGHATSADCWDGNPCTDDAWDPIAGQCSAVPRVCPSDGDACDGPEVCDPATGACGNDAAAAPSCDDGVWCNGSEACAPASGVCVVGTPPAVDDGHLCTIDACDEAGDTVRHLPDDARCFATRCEVAACTPGTAGADAAGCVRTPVPIIADALECTDDVCDPASGATIHPIHAGFCVIDGACYADGALDPSGCGRCAPSVRATAWTDVLDGTACDDGLYCTVNDTCAAGACVGAARDCGLAPLPCLAVACDELDDECQLAVRPNGAWCDDGDACNGIATCTAGTCVPGTPIVVNDGLTCTDDVCDPFLGVLHPPNDALCNADDNGCTLDDRCAGGACVAGADVDCSAADDQCNVGRCASTGAGSFTCLRDPAPREGLSCDDNDLCSLGDHCAAGACVAGSYVECPDGTCVAGLCVSDVDGGPTDAAVDAPDGDAADSGLALDAALDAGSDDSLQGCGCGTAGSDRAGAFLAVILLIAIGIRPRCHDCSVSPRDVLPGRRHRGSVPRRSRAVALGGDPSPQPHRAGARPRRRRR